MTFDAYKYAEQFMNYVDSRDWQSLTELLSEDVRLQMANWQAIEGRNNLLETFSRSVAQFSSVTHKIQGVWSGVWTKGQVISVEAIACYELSSGQIIRLPVTSTLRINLDNKVVDYRIFMDPAPAFS